MAVLKKGSHGPDVGTVQTMLNQCGAHLVVDQSYGKATDAAVRAFQRANKLPIDGKVGDVTMKALRYKSQTKPGPAPAPQPYMRPIHAGADFDMVVPHYEGISKKVYNLDGVLHAGCGHALTTDSGFRVGDTVTDSQIDAWYQSDKAKAEARLNKLVTSKVNQKQYDALCSIVWNGGNADDPTDEEDSPIFYHTPHGILMAAVNAEDWTTAAQIIVALGDKPTSTGKVFGGIKTRRLTESELFRGVSYRLR